jgi:hypothetical protein
MLGCEAAFTDVKYFTKEHKNAKRRCSTAR